MINAIVDGVLLGGVYALLACGLSLMFGVMRIINLAHGSLALVGAYMTLLVVEHTSLGAYAALLEPEGSGHKSFCQAQPNGILPAVLSSTYDKLAHLPPAVSEAFLAEGADRLRQVFPDNEVQRLDDPIAPSLGDFEIIVLDGKVVKRVPRRLRPARQCKGGLLGGKGLVALHLRSGLALALATDPDGEANDAQLVPDLLPQVRSRLEGPRLWLADRQFCDLIQTAAGG